MMRKSAIAALVVMFTLGTAPSLHAATQRDWETYIDAVAAGLSAAANVAVGEVLPPGVGDVVSALNASPDIVKVALIQWLHAKMQRAAIDDDMSRLDRYQAFLTCLTNHDCAKVRAITSVSGGTNDTIRGKF
jgi:hypothetical protein